MDHLRTPISTKNSQFFLNRTVATLLCSLEPSASTIKLVFIQSSPNIRIPARILEINAFTAVWWRFPGRRRPYWEDAINEDLANLVSELML